MEGEWKTKVMCCLMYGDTRNKLNLAESGSSLKQFLFFNITKKHLDGIRVYIDQQKVLLDIQDVFMKLFGCSDNTVQKKISIFINNRKPDEIVCLSKFVPGNVKPDYSVWFFKHRLPGTRGAGRLVAEFRHALELFKRHV